MTTVRKQPKAQGRESVGVCILAGGLSQRMGREKASLRLAGRSLLGHVRLAASGLGVRVRVIRRDLVPRCGPLGGVHTGLVTSRAGAELFLACDMPLITTGLLRRLRAKYRASGRAVFAFGAGRVGFPLILPCELAEEVARQIDRGSYSLAALAKRVGAVRLPVRTLKELTNLNTPGDLLRAISDG